MNDLKNWEKIKTAVLGVAYDLSLALIGDKKARELNRQLRGKDKIANILSFPLSESSGEILINRRQAARDGQTLFKLFIHGLLHLKGLDHGSTMSREERKLLRRFTLNGSSPRRRT